MLFSNPFHVNARLFLSFPQHHGLRLLVFVLFWGGLPLLLKGSDDWPPVPPEDLALKEHPNNPGSSAMVLLKTDFLDESKEERQIYRRIKIFSEGGREAANIEIPFVRGSQKVKNLQARVIRTDGEVIDFDGPIYEKTLVRTKKEGALVKAFVLPQIEPGCIIEYRYRLEGKNLLLGGTWYVQEPLFVREARLTWIPGRNGLCGLWAPLNLPIDSPLAATRAGSAQVTLHNVAALEEEVLMPPMVTVQGHYRFKPLLMAGGPASWEPLGEMMLEYLHKMSNDFIGKPKEVRRIAEDLICSEDSAELKLQKLYAAVQSRARNLSYEERYTKKERKRENLKERKSAKDVWSLGYGLEAEITELFVALCRAVAFQADLGLVIPRDQRFYDPELPLSFQVTAPVAVVDTSQGIGFFDPGTRFCSFGLLSWEKQMVKGLRLLPDGRFEEIVTPLEAAEENMTHRRVEMQLTEDGDVAANLTVELSGQEAIRQKNAMAEIPSEQWQRSLVESVQTRFPTAGVEKTHWEGLEGSEETVELSYIFHLPGYAIRAGPRLLVRAILFVSQSPFPHQERSHPVYFPYPTTRIDEVHIKMPPGYRLEQVPDRCVKVTDCGNYELEVIEEKDLVRCRRKMALQGVPYLELGQYPLLKQFYDAAQAYDQLLLILANESKSSGDQ